MGTGAKYQFIGRESPDSIVVKATQDQLSTLDLVPSFLFGHDKVIRVSVPPRERSPLNFFSIDIL